eukprot:CAMPEP_0119302946 /NCGR_PEP_ID=MMETSP1333-20130426/4461_1 /TAXON_ID=418940 /ORGANISM="Scyphosphaera apsteinii, Strain RCC1455" /LENGTH=900 /DNA_ID=CAMNT_0007305473 /DNA_START=47 /DNA_END=2749 /DNA_ORIENTATION=-
MGSCELSQTPLFTHLMWPRLQSHCSGVNDKPRSNVRPELVPIGSELQGPDNDGSDSSQSGSSYTSNGPNTGATPRHLGDRKIRDAHAALTDSLTSSHVVQAATQCPKNLEADLSQRVYSAPMPRRKIEHTPPMPRRARQQISPFPERVDSLTASPLSSNSSPRRGGDPSFSRVNRLLQQPTPARLAEALNYASQLLSNLPLEPSPAEPPSSADYIASADCTDITSDVLPVDPKVYKDMACCIVSLVRASQRSRPAARVSSLRHSEIPGAPSSLLPGRLAGQMVIGASGPPTRILNLEPQMDDNSKTNINLTQQRLQHSSDNHPFLQEALNLALDVSKRYSLKLALLEEDILSLIMPLLEDGMQSNSREDTDNASSYITLQLAVQVVSELTAIEQFKSWVGQPGLLKCLVNMLGSAPLPLQLREDAARSLKNIALDDEVREAMAAQRAIQVMIDVCMQESESHVRLLEQTARALGNMAVCDAIEQRIVSANGVRALMPLLASEDVQVVDAALGGLANLVGNVDMRAYFVAERGVSLLQEPMKGDNEALYKQAGWILSSLAVDPDLSERIVEDGALPLLVIYANNENPTYQEEAAWALANLSSSSSNAQPMINAGAVAPLLRLATSATLGVRMQSLWAVANLAVHDDFKLLMGELGAIPVLVGSLSQSDEATLMQAARAIANLAVASVNRERVVAEQGIGPLLQCASLPFESVQEAVARALVNLSFERDFAMMIIEMDGVNPITRLLASPNSRVQQEAAWVVVNFSVCSDAEINVEKLLGALFEPLVDLLSSAQPAVQEQAAWALANLSRNPATKLRIIELGALEVLRKLHKSPSDELQAASAQVLTSLGQVLTPNSRRVISRIQEHNLGKKGPPKGSPLGNMPSASTADGERSWASRLHEH